eukprot:TRINITY_DN67491_c0_g1_i1.p1 TRINITY_DN67491_c0_g1~~TRINITY_DN67491_c0_g1_i1.p1  ORF type:complete len:345 (-),score=46.67 TRINITY_DN67491_c0_g1_i1:86-1051(-)
MFSQDLLGVLITNASNLQFVRASTDLIITVDANWMLMEEFLGLPAGEFFLSVVSSEEQRQAILAAAQQADRKDASLAQKIAVTLRMVSGRLLEAECMISRCLCEQRHLALSWIGEAYFAQGHHHPAAAIVDVDSHMIPLVEQSSLVRAPSSEVQSGSCEDETIKIRRWCVAARSFGQECLVPDARPSSELEHACQVFLEEADGQNFELLSTELPFSLREGDLHDSWDQLWTALEDALMSRLSSSSTSSSQLQQAQRAFLGIVDVLGVHLWPWLGRSIMIYSRNPFGTFRENGSVTSWTCTATTRSVTARASGAATGTDAII